MGKDPAVLRKRMLRYIWTRWSCLNTYDRNYHPTGDFSCVYMMASFDIVSGYSDIVYVGSTTNLKDRYRSHHIPRRISEEGLWSVLFFKIMPTGFYDYEIRLIKRLQPRFNKVHR